MLLLWHDVYAAEFSSKNIHIVKRYISVVERRNQIPAGLLAAIVSVESNFKAYAVNVDGKTVITNSRLEAIKAIHNALGQGISNIDVGLGQINYCWHKDHFRNIGEMINPKTNIEYAGKLLSSLFKQYGTWNKAISYYHSANHEYQGQYSKKVVVAWIGDKKIYNVRY